MPAIKHERRGDPGCGAPTASDPGNSKYFAMYADGNKGRIYKAYRDFANDTQI